MDDPTRTIRFLVVNAVLGWALLGTLLVTSFSSEERLRVDEIDAERVNIVGADGEPVMALAHRGRIPGPTFGGREYPRGLADGRQHLSGIIFFNDQGDEVGGLIYNGIPRDSGWSAVGHLSFDQWKQNQVVALQYVDHSGRSRAGLRVWDRPDDVPIEDFFEIALERFEAEDEAVRDSLADEIRAMRERGDLGVERMFVGSREASALVELRDTRGRVRARLYVDRDDRARLEFLDEAGEPSAVYPPE